MNDPSQKGRAASALFSFIWPGSGQLYQGYGWDACRYFGVAVVCWDLVIVLLYLLPALPTWLAVLGVAGHVLAARDAARIRPPRTSLNERKRRLP